MYVPPLLYPFKRNLNVKKRCPHSLCRPHPLLTLHPTVAELHPRYPAGMALPRPLATLLWGPTQWTYTALSSLHLLATKDTAIHFFSKHSSLCFATGDLFWFSAFSPFSGFFLETGHPIKVYVPQDPVLFLLDTLFLHDIHPDNFHLPSSH